MHKYLQFIAFITTLFSLTYDRLEANEHSIDESQIADVSWSNASTPDKISRAMSFHAITLGSTILCGAGGLFLAATIDHKIPEGGWTKSVVSLSTALGALIGARKALQYGVAGKSKVSDYTQLAAFIGVASPLIFYTAHMYSTDAQKFTSMAIRHSLVAGLVVPSTTALWLFTAPQ